MPERSQVIDALMWLIWFLLPWVLSIGQDRRVGSAFVLGWYFATAGGIALDRVRHSGGGPR